jgi:hypothetical protein
MHALQAAAYGADESTEVNDDILRPLHHPPGHQPRKAAVQGSEALQID